MKNINKFERGFEAEKELPWDAKNEITNEDREGMKEQIKYWGKSTTRTEFACLSMAMKILNPEEELNINQDDWQDMRKSLEFFRTNHDWENFSEQALAMKILNPAEDIRLNNQDAWQNMRKELKDLKKRRETGKFFSLAARMRIIGPAAHDRLYFDEFDEKAQHDLEESLKTCREIAKEKGNWEQFAEYALAANFLYPPDKSPDINQKDWEGMKKKLDEYRKESHWSAFAEQAVAMKILTNPKGGKIHLGRGLEIE
jgi:hypothetical protein